MTLRTRRPDRARRAARICARAVANRPDVAARHPSHHLSRSRRSPTRPTSSGPPKPSPSGEGAFTPRAPGPAPPGSRARPAPRRPAGSRGGTTLGGQGPPRPVLAPGLLLVDRRDLEGHHLELAIAAVQAPERPGRGVAHVAGGAVAVGRAHPLAWRSEEHPSELQPQA